MSRSKYDLTSAEKEGEDFMSKNWRPMMAVTYMITCLFDFVAGPILYNVLQFYNPGQHLEMWQSITLQGGGLYHIAMGAVLGIAAHGRTQEKINGADTPAPGIGGMINNFMPQQEQAPQPSFAPPQPSFTPPQPSFAPPQPSFAPIESGRFGKKLPEADDPIL